MSKGNPSSDRLVTDLTPPPGVVMSWNQNICEGCWFERNPGRFPISLKRPDPEDYSVDRCAYCGTATISRIYVRDDPANVSFPQPNDDGG